MLHFTYFCIMLKKDITTLTDVKVLVDTFYAKVRENTLIGPIFNDRIQDRWPAHLDKMYRFWQTILLSEHTYSGAPFVPHSTLPVDKAHFDTWLALFYETVEDLFVGEIADEAKMRATKMAEMFQYKLEYYRTNNAKPLV